MSLALAACLGVFFNRTLGGGVALIRRDSLTLYGPLKAFMASELQRGHWPTWFPYDNLGTSLIGDAVGGLLHPSNLLLLLMSPPQALKWTCLMAIAAAALGTAILAQRLGAAATGQWTAGLSYALAGYTLSLADNLPYLLSAATLPWVLALALAVAEAPSLARTLALGLALAWTAWGGDLQAFAVQGALSAIVIVLWSAKPRRARSLAAASGALVTALALCAPLLPAIGALALETGRAEGFQAGQAMAWSLHPLRLFELALGQPYLPSDLDQSELATRFLGGYQHGFWSISVFFGAIPFALALVGASAGGSSAGARRALAITSVISLALALGPFGAFYPLALKVFPFFSSFRYPEKLLPFALAPACALAGYGCHLLGRRETTTLRVAAALGMAFAILGLAASPSGVQRVLSLMDRGGPALGLEWLNHLSIVARTRCAEGALFLAALAACHRLGLRAAVPLLILIDAMATVSWAFPAGPASLTQASAPLASAVRGEVTGSLSRVCWAVDHLSVEDRPGDAVGEAIARGQVDTMFADLGAEVGAGYIHADGPGYPRLARQQCQRPTCGTPCSRSLGGGLLVVDPESAASLAADPAIERIGSSPDGAAVLLRDAAARPFASLPAVRHVESADLERALVDVQRRPAEEIWLARDGRPDQPAPGGTIRASRPAGDQIDADVEAHGPGEAVFTELCSAGWSASVDGSPARLDRGDGLFCAVAVAAGRHHVLLSYQPPGWPWAWLPYGLALALLAWVSVRERLNPAGHSR